MRREHPYFSSQGAVIRQHPNQNWAVHLTRRLLDGEIEAESDDLGDNQLPVIQFLKVAYIYLCAACGGGGGGERQAWYKSSLPFILLLGQTLVCAWPKQVLSAGRCHSLKRPLDSLSVLAVKGLCCG